MNFGEYLKNAQTFVIVARFKLKVKRRDVWGVAQSHLGLCMRDWSVKKMAEMAENKMEQVAAMFGKQLGERFTVECCNDRFDCKFSTCGFVTYGAYENPYLDFDGLILEALLRGEAVIVDERGRNRVCKEDAGGC